MALIITRRVGETLMIGEDVTVTPIGVKGGQIKLAIEAPRNIEVDREEVREKKLAERQST